MKINYQLEMERRIARFVHEGVTPRLLLHACCAPCSSAVLERLSEFFKITVLYYNPNISPKEEYDARLKELARLIFEMPAKHPISLLTGKYNPELFYQTVYGRADDREGGVYCTKCYRLRLEAAAHCAAQGGYDLFTTTLSISPLKDAQRLNAIGLELAQEYGVEYLVSDFKKKNGYKRSCELSQQHGLYRQDYCGCIFSKKEREARL